MIYRRLDENWDMTFGRGMSNFLFGREAVGQAIKSRLLLFLAEWWEDQADGLPLWQSILGVMGTSKQKIDAIVQARILGTPNVSGIVSMASSLVNRAYQFVCTVNTAFGQVTVSSQGVIQR